MQTLSETKHSPAGHGPQRKSKVLKRGLKSVTLKENERRKKKDKDYLYTHAEKQSRTKERDRGRGDPQRTTALRQILAAAQRSSCRYTASVLCTWLLQLSAGGEKAESKVKLLSSYTSAASPILVSLQRGHRDSIPPPRPDPMLVGGLRGYSRTTRYL